MIDPCVTQDLQHRGTSYRNPGFPDGSGDTRPAGMTWILRQLNDEPSRFRRQRSSRRLGTLGWLALSLDGLAPTLKRAQRYAMLTAGFRIAYNPILLPFLDPINDQSLLGVSEPGSD